MRRSQLSPARTGTPAKCGASAQSGRSLSTATFAPLALALALYGLARWQSWQGGGPNTVAIPYWGALVTFCAWLPALRWRARQGRIRTQQDRPIPFLPVIGLLYGMYFGMPVLLDGEFTAVALRHTLASTERALQLALLGWLCLCLGWHLSRSLFRGVPSLALKIDPERSRRARPWLLGVGAAAILAQRVVDLPGPAVQPVRFLQMLFQVGLGLMVLDWFRGRLDRTATRVLWLGVVPAYLFIQVGVGSVAQLAYAAVFLCFVTWGSGKRVPILALGTLGAVVFLLRGHVHEFREQVWRPEGSAHDAGVWEQSVLFAEIIGEKLGSGTGQAISEAADEVIPRVAHLGTFAHVVAMTPSTVPYWNGRTYAALPSTWIPRFLWPDKPSKEIGQAFGHRYLMIGSQDKTTAVNLPQLVEFYANFGERGVLFGMLVVGLLYGLFQRLWNTPGTGEGTLLLAAIVYSRLILIESDFTLVWGAVLQQVVFLFIVLRRLRPASDRRPSRWARYLRPVRPLGVGRGRPSVVGEARR